MPQVRAREMLVAVEHPVIGRFPLPNLPIKLSRTPGGIRGPSPGVGQHTGEVLRELLGLAEEEVAELAREGVVMQGDEHGPELGPDGVPVPR